MEDVENILSEHRLLYFQYLNNNCIKFVFFHNIIESFRGLHNLGVLPGSDVPGVTSWQLADTTGDPVL